MPSLPASMARLAWPAAVAVAARTRRRNGCLNMRSAMSILVGAISRTGGDLPRALCLALAANISRRPAEPIEEFGGGCWFLAKADVGAYRSKGSIGQSMGSAFVMAGEALLCGERYRSC